MREVVKKITMRKSFTLTTALRSSIHPISWGLAYP